MADAISESDTAAATRSGGAAAAGTGPGRGFGWLALAAAAYTYALIVFGGIVRITGSGMGCGDDWPRCNGEWIPAFELATLIEYTHRLLAAGLGFVILAVVVAALRHRRRPGFSGPGGPLRPVLAAGGLLIVQVLLGAITVKLELPASTTVLHFGAAMLLLAALLLAGIRGLDRVRTKRDQAADDGQQAVNTVGARDPVATRQAARRTARAATAAAALGFVVVLFGALTANTGAAPLCQGFPLCNGELVPAGGPLVHVHWTHRLVAFLLFFHVVGATLHVWRRGAAPSVVWGASAALALVLLQLVVAAALVLLQLPASLQSLHLAVGAAIWAALVAWAAAARRATHEPSGTESRVHAAARLPVAALDPTEGA